MAKHSQPHRTRAATRIITLLITILLLPIIVRASSIQWMPGQPPLAGAFPMDSELGMTLPEADSIWVPASAGLAATLPARWDWRRQGKVTPVKNQSLCQISTIYAMLGHLESAMLMRGQSVHDFSEHDVAHCQKAPTLRGCHINHYTNVGSVWSLTSHLSDRGTVLDECAPLNIYNPTCNLACPRRHVVTNMWALTRSKTAPSTQQLKQWLYTYGPLYVTMDSSYTAAWAHEFRNYDGSYVLSFQPAYAEPDHAVLLVGWDDAYAGSTGAWIVKNSWGTGWGGTCGYGSERGYFAIAYGSALVGSNAAVIREWRLAQDEETLLYIDEAGPTVFSSYSMTTEAWGLVRLVPPHDGYATQFEFWTGEPTVDVDLYIYDDFNTVQPSNLLWSYEDLAFAYAGYHAVPISPPFPLTANDEVVLVARIRNRDTIYTLPTDTIGGYTIGRSYASPTGAPGTWTETGGHHFRDIGLRLRMRTTLPEPDLWLPLIVRSWS
jgi:C1A family cysteine protease